MKRSMCLAIVASIVTGILAGGAVQITNAAETFIDDFNVDHVYWDGGLPFTDGTYPPFYIPALYVDITGDFDARLQMDVLPTDVEYLTVSLAAWTADQQSAIHLDNIAVTSSHVRFRNLVKGDPLGFVELKQNIDRQPWFRMTRTGNVFEGFYSSDGSSWTSMGQIERDYGDTLRVGPATWNGNPAEYVGSFSSFEVVGVGSDDFNTDHVYWDGSTVDVGGTMWSGLQGTSCLSDVNANTTAASELQFSHIINDFNADVSGTIWDGAQGSGYATSIQANTSTAGELQVSHAWQLSNGTAQPFDVSALYKSVTGDFDAKIRMDMLPEDIGYLTLSLAAWTEDQENAIHLDNIAATGNHVRFRDLDPGDEYALAIDRQPWLRMIRDGDTFYGFYSSDGESWTLIGSMERDYGETLLVGPATWNGTKTGYTGSFSYFEINIGDVSFSLIPGDANGNGIVDENDAAILAENWLATGADWSMGDFNEDGVVNDADATLLAANWQGSSSSENVPEPGAFVLLIGAMFGLLAWSRRRTA